MEHTRAASFFRQDVMDYTRVLLPSLDRQDHPRPLLGSWADFLARTRVWPSPAPALEHVNAGRVTDFSIERILSPDVEASATPEQILNSCYVAPGTFHSYLCHAFCQAHFSQDYAYATACHAGQRSAEERRRVQQRKSRLRTVFTDAQLRSLEELFQRTRYPTPETRAELAHRTGLREDTVRIWFKNQRARRKRQSSSPQSSQGR